MEGRNGVGDFCGRAEQSPAPTGLGNVKGRYKEIKGRTKETKREMQKGKEKKKKKETGGIGNHKRKRSFLGKA